ncbi:MAG: hypothetical protein V1846_00965 [Candidatus Komeilibacteria bacterium]
MRTLKLELRESTTPLSRIMDLIKNPDITDCAMLVCERTPEGDMIYRLKIDVKIDDNELYRRIFGISE